MGGMLTSSDAEEDRAAAARAAARKAGRARADPAVLKARQAKAARKAAEERDEILRWGVPLPDDSVSFPVHVWRRGTAGIMDWIPSMVQIHDKETSLYVGVSVPSPGQSPDFIFIKENLTTLQKDNTRVGFNIPGHPQGNIKFNDADARSQFLTLIGLVKVDAFAEAEAGMSPQGRANMFAHQRAQARLAAKAAVPLPPAGPLPPHSNENSVVGVRNEDLSQPMAEVYDLRHMATETDIGARLQSTEILNQWIVHYEDGTQGFLYLKECVKGADYCGELVQAELRAAKILGQLHGVVTPLTLREIGVGSSNSPVLLVIQGDQDRDFILYKHINGEDIALAFGDGVGPISRDLEKFLIWTTQEILKTLQRIHQSGWVHNDIKPENILIGTSTTFYTPYRLDDTNTLIGGPEVTIIDLDGCEECPQNTQTTLTCQPNGVHTKEFLSDHRMESFLQGRLFDGRLGDLQSLRKTMLSIFNVTRVDLADFVAYLGDLGDGITTVDDALITLEYEILRVF